MARKNKAEKTKKEGSKVLTVLIALLISIIWFTIFGILIKLDVGGFGSGVLRPIIKDVPLINKILPYISDKELAVEKDFEYSSLAEAVAKIKELESTIEEIESSKAEETDKEADLLAELERLKIFEENQKDFEERQKKFDRDVIFAQAAPDIEEYKQYYEEINPANAELIYRQVVEQLQYSEAILEKANLFKSMNSKAAAKILETMTADVESVAKILLAMKPKEGAAILAEMDHVLAAKITKKMLDIDEARLSVEE
jgi:flagellar motility protein MotE (MotC chaperone)